MTQKVTMLIEVIPSPRLDIVRECGKSGHAVAETGRPVNDSFMNETVSNTVHNAEVHASCLAFDVAQEDLLLLDSESMKSLLSGAQKSVVVVFSSSKSDDIGDNDCDAEQKNPTKIRLTFLPIFQKSKFVNNGIRREENNRRNNSDPDDVSNRFPKKRKNLFQIIQSWPIPKIVRGLLRLL
jgi:hypothetical protein